MARSSRPARPFVRKEITRDEALELFTDEPYKLELIRELPEGEVISIYEEGDFVDLCRGPHVANTGEIKAFKLLRRPARTGAATSTTRCSSASTARHSRRQRSSTTT